jgi:hypothetical protein
MGILYRLYGHEILYGTHGGFPSKTFYPVLIARTVTPARVMYD